MSSTEDMQIPAQVHVLITQIHCMDEDALNAEVLLIITVNKREVISVNHP